MWGAQKLVIQDNCLLQQAMHVVLPSGESPLAELLPSPALVGQDAYLL